MKRQIFILSSLLCICGIQHATASDYIEESEPAEMAVTTEQDIATDNVEFNDAKYITINSDEIATAQPCQDELVIPSESTQNLWTDDAFVHNSKSKQAVVLKQPKVPKEARAHKLHKNANMAKMSNGEFSFGDQTYFGETVYIINNFLSQDTDNVSETDDAADLSIFEKRIGKFANTTSIQGCPFDTLSECAVWARKPTIYETVSPHSKMLRTDVMNNISNAIKHNSNISANAKVMAPLLNRYRVLMRASQSCCTGGITYKLTKAGETQKLVYKLLADDANFTGFGSRCMVMADQEIDENDGVNIESGTVINVRNNCICKSKQSLSALLAPFDELYRANPEFASAPFEYRHMDGLGRDVTDSINTDIQNVLDVMETCP